MLLLLLLLYDGASSKKKGVKLSYMSALLFMVPKKMPMCLSAYFVFLFRIPTGDDLVLLPFLRAIGREKTKKKLQLFDYGRCRWACCIPGTYLVRNIDPGLKLTLDYPGELGTWRCFLVRVIRK